LIKRGWGRFATHDSSLWFMPLSGTQNDEYDNNKYYTLLKKLHNGGRFLFVKLFAPFNGKLAQLS